ncbi:MAG: hypothetical protein SFY96_04190 [Planctomycetota bacterium]|nr:hypothetical protein [Planctomycetota bacterium]
MTSDAGQLNFGEPSGAGSATGASVPSAASAMALERVERLLAVIAQQQKLIEQVESLAGHQAQLVAADDAGERLLSLLAERQVLIEGLEALAGQARPVRRELEPHLGLVDPRRRDELVKREAILAQTIARVAKRDQEDAGRLAQRRDRLADEIAGLGRNRRAMSAYGGEPGQIPPSFQDRNA